MVNARINNDGRLVVAIDLDDHGAMSMTDYREALYFIVGQTPCFWTSMEHLEAMHEALRGHEVID